MSFCGLDAESWTGISAAGTCIAAFATFRTVKEMALQRREAIRPEIDVFDFSFKMEVSFSEKVPFPKVTVNNESGSFLELKVINFGKGRAKNIVGECSVDFVPVIDVLAPKMKALGFRLELIPNAVLCIRESDDLPSGAGRGAPRFTTRILFPVGQKDVVTPQKMMLPSALFQCMGMAILTDSLAEVKPVLFANLRFSYEDSNGVRYTSRHTARFSEGLWGNGPCLPGERPTDFFMEGALIVNADETPSIDYTFRKVAAVKKHIEAQFDFMNPKGGSEV